MTKRTNDTGWAELIGGLAQIALVGGAAYVVYQAREAYIERLLACSTSDAIKSLLETIPGMDENTWNLFLSGMNSRAQTSSHAEGLLAFASIVHKITETVNHLLSKPIQQAKFTLENTVHDMDDATWNVFRYVLETRTGDRLQAQALLNYAENNRNKGGFAEDLFRESLQAALADGIITSKEASDLEALRHKLNMPAETGRRILSEVRNELRQSPR